MTSNTSKALDPNKISKMIRSAAIGKVDLVSEVKKDIQQSILNNSKNNIDFYNIKTNIVQPKKPIPAIQNFQSSMKPVQQLGDQTSNKIVAQGFREPRYNFLEKEAISEIRQKNGKFTLISDIYQEFSTPKEMVTKKERAQSTTSSRLLSKASEAREVEDLDKWTEEKVKNIKFFHNSEIEELRKEVNRMLFFMEEEGLSHTYMKAVNSLFDELDALRKKEESFPSLSHLTSSSKIFGESPRELPPINDKNKSNSLLRSSKVKGHEDMDWRLPTSQGYDEMANSMHLSSIQMRLKDRLRHFKSIHEPIEKKLSKYISEIEGELDKGAQTVAKLSKQNEQFNRKIKLLTEYIDKINAKKNKSQSSTTEEEDSFSENSWCNLAASGDHSKKSAQEIEIIRNLKDEINKYRTHVETNEAEIKKIENERIGHSKKLKVFNRIKMKLYIKILKHGLDCREDGFVWVLKDLIREGENITFDNFPAYMDNSSKSFLLQKSKLLNELVDMRSSEKSLVNEYRNSFEETISSRLFANTSPKNNNIGQSTGSFTSLNKTPTSKDKKAKTLNEIEDPSNVIETTESFNELDFELEVENISRQKSIEPEVSNKQSGSVNQPHGKSVSFACIPEEKNEDSLMTESPKLKKKNSSMNLSKMMTIQFQRSKSNINELLYQETRILVNQICHEKKILNRESANEAQLKKELIEKMKFIQMNITKLMNKIYEEDQKEGMRILKEYNAKKLKIDLEFYLASVLGLVQAEKLSRRFG